MFELRIKLDFPAAHHLEGYPGDCQRVHGHNWGVEVFARSKGLDSIGLAVDFRELKQAVKSLIDRWDHQDLNAHEDFRELNPSAENIAKLTYTRLSERVNTANTKIHRVTIWENERSSASYFED